MSIDPISCIVLAGGEGKRFNREDKGLVTLNNKPLVAHVTERLKNQVDEIIISANRNIDTYRQYAAHVVADKHDTYQGPLAGIVAALPHCSNPWVLVVPCDIPLLPDNLITILKPDNTNKLHVIKIDGRLQLIFLLHHDLLSSLNKYLDDGYHKVMDWIEMQQPVVIELDTKIDAFTNLNTPEQLEQLADKI